MTNKPTVRIDGLDAAIEAFMQSQTQRDELFASVASFQPSLGKLAAQLPDLQFRKDLAASLAPTYVPKPVSVDIVRGLQVLDLSRMWSETLDPLRSVKESLQRSMELQASLLEQIRGPIRAVTLWLEQHREVMASIAASIAQFHEEQKRRAANAQAFAERHGWPLPILLLGHEAFTEIADMVNSPRRSVSRAMKSAFGPKTRARREAVEAVLSSPHFASRQPLLRQATDAMRRDKWYLVINALLPLLEGVLVDVAFPPGTKPERGAVKKSLGALTGQNDALSEAMLASLETLIIGAGAGSAVFDGFDPNDYGVPGEPRGLNRHAILHGSARRYGTSENALKLFLLLVVMIEALPPPPA